LAPAARPNRAKLSRHTVVAKPIDDMLTRWPAFTRFPDDERICLSDTAAERALRGLALAGSPRPVSCPGGERLVSLIGCD
jgi:hypothetical protein